MMKTYMMVADAGALTLTHCTLKMWIRVTREATNAL